MSEYEFIVVGGGSAGVALAARLSATKRKTLLLEAGGKRGSMFDFWKTAMPAAYSYAFMNPKINWMYEGEPEPGLNNRKMYQPRGKFLGGSSAINGMGFLRPHPEIFRQWVKSGATGWSFEDVLPYFKRLETWHGDLHPDRGVAGPIHVQNGMMDCPYYEAFLNAGEQAGYVRTSDINVGEQEGFGHFQMNVEKGVRASSAHGYLRHVAKMKWLDIVDFAHVTRVILRKSKAVGVEFVRKEKSRQVFALKETILCGGAFNTPQLLMLSGIGPEEELQRHKISTHVHLSGVGKNLQDHPIVYPKYQSQHQDSPIRYQRLDRKVRVGMQWLLTHSGPGATNYMEAAALIKSDKSAPFPDIEFQFCPLVIDHAEGGARNDIHGWSNSCGPVTVEGRGWVKLRSADPFDPPRILCNFMSTERDIKLMHRAFEVNRDVMNQPAMRAITKTELEPGVDVRSKSAIHEYLLENIAGDYHPVGSCKMGSPLDPDSVVDPALKVIGIDNLRIADASVMPFITNANTNATSIMIGERAADFVLYG